mgnify:CR=1 FL=1
MKKMKLVMVGNGMAGVRTLEELLKIAPDHYDVTVFGAEPHPNYNRILLSPVLAGEQTLDEIVLNPLSWYEENGIRLHLGKKVVDVDRRRRVVKAADGTEEEYDRLLLATGSEDLLASRDDSVLVYTPTTSGLYYLSATSYFDTGSYILTMTTSGGAGDIPEDLTSTARLPVNGSFSSRIDVASDLDWLVTTLSAGTGYSLSVSGLPAPASYLFDMNGTFVRSIAPGQTFSVPANGEYFIMPRGQARVAEKSLLTYKPC